MLTQITGIITSIFPDDINTDDIIPAWTLQEGTDRVFFKKYAFANYDREFIKRCSKEKNNIIVAGENFGGGSSREQAVYALQENKVAAVIAKSYPDIFYRNALNNGLLLITADDINLLHKKDTIMINLEKKTITINDEKIISFEMDDDHLKIFAIGGKLGKVKKHLEKMIASSHRPTVSVEVPTPSRRSPRSASAHLGGVTPLRITSHNFRPQTMVEKIVSDHIGKSVFAGEKIEKLPIDVLYLNEVIAPPAIKEFLADFSAIYKKKEERIKVFDPKRVFFIPDHTVPSCSVTVSEGITFMEDFAKEQGIKCYKEGDGIEHVVLIEDGYIVPGEIILGTDSHTDTNGALNTLAFGIGTTDACYALATGHLYDFEIPKTIRVNLSGKFQKRVYTKDLILYLIGQIGVDGALQKIIEFGGPALTNISMDGRTTMANMAVEMGARTAIFEPDEVLKKYLQKKAKFPYKFYRPDKNCHYPKIIEIDLSTLEPCVAFPHKPENVTFISKMKNYMIKSQKSKSADFAKVESLKITDAFLGGCTNGRYEDLVETAKILKGKKVHSDVNFIAIPASRKIYNKLLKEGILQIFAEAGANIESPNCGPCFGKQMGVVGKGAQMISSSNRNYIGRMGSKDAKIFLASPVTVAAAAIAGEIVNPRRYL